jgi:hypothetical protein
MRIAITMRAKAHSMLAIWSRMSIIDTIAIRAVARVSV